MRPRYSALPNSRQDNSTLADRLHRYRSALLVILAQLALVSLVLLLMPRPPASSSSEMAYDPTAGCDGNPAEEVVRAEVSISVRPSSSSSSLVRVRGGGDPISARARTALALLRRAFPDLPARMAPPRA
jgi:hypothetical protein